MAMPTPDRPASHNDAHGSRPGLSTLRGAIPPGAGLADDVAAKIHDVLAEHGLANEPVGVDLVEMPVLAALTARGLSVVDGQQVFLEARRIKTPDEILLLTHACSMVACRSLTHSLPACRAATRRRP